MAPNEQLIRQHKLLQILERYRFGRTLSELRDELVEELGLTSLTHAQCLSRCRSTSSRGVRCGHRRKPTGGAFGKSGRDSRVLTKSPLRRPNSWHFRCGRDLMHPLAGTPFLARYRKFLEQDPRELARWCVGSLRQVSQDPACARYAAKSYEKHQGMLKTINRAILEHRVLEIEYQRLGQVQARTRRVEPYGIVFYPSSLYVVADVCL